MSYLSLASSGGTPNLKGTQKVFMHNHGEEETVDLSGVGRESIAPSSLLNAPTSLHRSGRKHAEEVEDHRLRQQSLEASDDGGGKVLDCKNCLHVCLGAFQ
ncbi:hypothetical protein DV515_00002088 [Chloebia gouldiae]|uniref:Uncharacterized protein n=1 Tax=Chloebia gouldiae TaxID=44316 RepID=A0A3L8SXU3_CHLGU|nr:hypothetical protein DV515_00002088 [Chloebia gouldiae]